MTHPLTPREKVEQAVRAASRGQWTDGVRVGSAKWCNGLTDAIITALASGSGDHAELAKSLRDSTALMATTASVRMDVWQDHSTRALRAADALEALLAEIAALRAERTFLIEQKEGAEDALFDGMSRATEAERALSEHRITADLLVSSLKADLAEAARKLAEAVEIVGAWLMQSCEDDQVPELQSRSRDFLSKEAERG